MGDSPTASTADPQLSIAVSDEPMLRLRPYVPRLVLDWLRHQPERSYGEVEGSLAFVDISGFTTLTERLARKGKVGAEEMSDTLNATFAALLEVGYRDGAGLVKWGGDAVLLLFVGAGHAERACRAAFRMRARLREIGRLQTSAGRITLRMSVGIHSGVFHFFLVGDPRYHRELIVSGPAASLTAVMEATAAAGEIAISPQTASLLPARCVGKAKGEGLLLRGEPDIVEVGPVPVGSTAGLDLASVVPVDLRAHLLAQPGEAEHRTIAVAFVQFSGTDALLEREGPQALADALHEVIANVQEATATHGVTFFETDINRDGGKIMLTAGAPTSRGHDEDRMLRAARVIIERAGRLPLRIGVNRGAVFSGDFGPVFRRTYSVKGDAVNLAARVMGKAAPGQVLATRAVFDRARTRFDSEDLPPFMVKGKTRPVDAVRLGAVRADEEPVDPSDWPVFVGRMSELAQLRDLLDAAASGHGSCVEVVGPPGIGKSRLVEEIRRASGGVRPLAVAGDEYGSVDPYSALRRLIRACLGLPRETAPEDAGRIMLEAVAVHAPQLLPWTPLLAAVVGVDVPSTDEVNDLDERFRRDRLEQTVARFLESILLEPSLIIIDDAHWLDDASASVCRRLVENRGSTPWLFVVARRPSPRGLVVEDIAGVVRLELQPMTRAEVTELLRSASADLPIAPHHRDTLVSRSGGNPLFLLELLQVGRQSGFLGALPESVEDVLASQIDGLAPAGRRVLRTASVLGMDVSMPVLHEMLGEDVGGLRELTDFLAPTGPETLRFRHAMLRDVAYEGLAFTRRRELHARAGRVLERRAGEYVAAAAPMLAVHFRHAGQHRAAWRYSRMAGEHARDIHAPHEAATFFQQALEAGRALGDVPAGDMLDAAAALGDAQSHLGEFTAAERSYSMARQWAETAVQRAVLQFKAALVIDRAGNYPRTLRTLSLAERQLSDQEGATQRLRAEIRAQYGLVRHRQGRSREAVRLLREAVQLAREAQAADVLATALLHLDFAELTAGMGGDGGHAIEAVRIQREFKDEPWLAARAFNQLGIRAYYAGRWTEAVAHYTASRDACERAGDTWTAAVESGNVAEVLSDQGRLADAEPVLREALETYRAAGTRSFLAYGTRILGRLLARRGSPGEGRDLLASARQIYVADGEALEIALTDALTAEACLLAGDLQAATELSGQALSATQAQPGRHLCSPLAHRVIGIAEHLLGAELESVLGNFDASITTARDHGLTYELALSLHAKGSLLDGPGSTAVLGEADALFAELGVIPEARDRLSGLELPVHRV